MTLLTHRNCIVNALVMLYTTGMNGIVPVDKTAPYVRIITYATRRHKVVGATRSASLLEPAKTAEHVKMANVKMINALTQHCKAHTPPPGAS